MHLKGYEVFISCDGKPLPEYSVKREGHDRKTIACFIPSECGKNFSIEWRDHSRKTHLRFVTRVDGRDVGGNRCRPGAKGVRWGVRTSTTTRQPFQFAPLQTTDDDENMYSTSSDASLGEIEVSVVRIRAEYRSVPHTMGRFRPVGAVHERSKKAGVHCVSLGANRQVPMSRTQTSSTPLNPREGSVAKFVFRYRPTSLLQAQAIIPRPAADMKPPRPDRKIKKRPADEMDDFEDVLHSQPYKRARPVYDVGEEDVKPNIVKVEVDLSKEEDVKPDFVKSELSDDEEEEEMVEADIVKVDSSDEEEDEEDLEQIQSQIQYLQEKYARVARRRSIAGSQPVSVKDEEPVKKEKPVKAEPGPASQLRGVVIDLTLDD